MNKKNPFRYNWDVILPPPKKPRKPYKWPQEELDNYFRQGYNNAKECLERDEWCAYSAVQWCNGGAADWLDRERYKAEKRFYPFEVWMEGAKQAHRDMLKILSTQHKSGL